MGLLKYEGDFKLRFCLAYNQNTNRTNNIYDGLDAYKALQLLWINRKLNDLNLRFLAINNDTSFAETIDGNGVVTEESVKYS